MQFCDKPESDASITHEAVIKYFNVLARRLINDANIEANIELSPSMIE